MKKNNFYLGILVFTFFFIIAASNIQGSTPNYAYVQNYSEQPLELSSSTYLTYNNSVAKHGFASNSIQWSFDTDKSYIDITVYAMDKDNYALITVGGYSYYTLSHGNRDQDDGSWTPPYSDTWYIVFINWDSNKEGTVLTYDAQFDPSDFWDFFDTYVFIFPIIFALACPIACAAMNRARTRARARPGYTPASSSSPYSARRAPPQPQSPQPSVPPQPTVQGQSGMFRELDSKSQGQVNQETSKHKFCELCGEQLDNDAIFCPSCGTKFSK